MSVEQDFLVFAGEAGANVLTQAEYVALAALLTGFQAGVAPSAQLNKVWRQSSIMAAVLGQIIADITGQPVIDDGTIATIEENLATVFRGLGKLGIDTGTANALVVTQAPVPSALYAGMDLTVIPANNGTGAVTLNVNGLGALPIQYPNGSALGSGAILAGIPVKFTLNSAKSAWIIGNNPTVPAATAPTQPVNLGQSFAGGSLYNVTSSRNLQTVYTNTGNRPRFVVITSAVPYGVSFYVEINGVVVANSEINNSGAPSNGQSLSVIVPPNATYEVFQGTSGGNISYWFEFY